MSVVDCPVLVADFGTSTSSGAVIGADGAIRMLKEPGSGSWSWPSAVAVHGEQLVVGTAAERRKKAAPQAYRAEFKRDLGQDLPIPLGDRSFAVTELIAAVLRVFGRQAAALIGRNVQRVVLTVPASYGPDDPRRELMITAGERRPDSPRSSCCPNRLLPRTRQWPVNELPRTRSCWCTTSAAAPSMRP